MSYQKFTNYSGNNSILDKFQIGTEYKDDIKIKKEIFRTEESGWSIYSVTNKKGFEFRVKGTFVVGLNINHEYKIRGVISNFKNTNDVKIQEIAPIRPKSKKAIISYLKTLKGLKTKAESIYEAFGDDSINILLNNPQRVADTIDKVGIKSTIKWSNQLKECFESQDTIARLLELELTPKAAKKLYDKYKDDIILKIETNPYFLASEVKGYGFEKCDRLAREIGIAPQDTYRIEEGIIHTLTEASFEGHCYLPKKELIAKVKELLDIKLTILEMKRCMYDFKGLETFKYTIGDANIYDLIYADLVNNYTLYNIEKNKIRKEKHRHMVYDIPIENVEKSIDTLVNYGRIVIEKDCIYLRSLHKSEVETANSIKNLIKYNDIYSKKYVASIVDEITSKEGIILEEKQRQSCIEFNTSENGLMALIGGAGTGKSFTLSFIIKTHKEIAKRNGRKIPKIQIVAPTGKAAKVASEATKTNCLTVHRCLGWNSDGFEYNKDNLLDLDALICDESSMLDIHLGKAFFEAVSSNSKVIIMGDTKQLPSVGAGSVLRDILATELVRFIELNVIKRQGLLSGTVQFANNIIDDEMLPNSVNTNDAFFLEREDIVNIKKTTIQSVINLIKNKGYDFNDIQVLIPQRTGALGVYMFNYVLQKQFNPKPVTKDNILACEFKAKPDEETDAIIYKLYFQEGDKVLNKNNNYSMVKYQKVKNQFIESSESGVTNGECGVIEYIKVEKQGSKINKKIMVKFDDFYALYEDDTIASLEHSFAITIHKSQGSAWKAVIVIITTSAWIMLSNNIIYTAVTRARDFVCVIGSAKAVKKSIKTHTPNMRYTNLKERICDTWLEISDINI